MKSAHGNTVTTAAGKELQWHEPWTTG